MIRFAWLQARTQTAVVAVGVAVVAVVGAVTGPHLAHVYATAMAACRAQQRCVAITNPFSIADYDLYDALGMVVAVLPALIGMFWGAPMVARELESGTHSLAWTQSVGRRRWLATKLAIGGLAAVATTGLLSLAVSWAGRSIVIEQADQFRYFDQRDIAPVGYAAFAFALGVIAGVVVRRVLPAIASTMTAFVVARYVMERWVRTHLVPASHASLALPLASNLGVTTAAGYPGQAVFQAGAPHIPNAYVLSARVVDTSGHPVSATTLHRFVVQHCSNIAQTPLVPGAPGLPAGRGPADPAAFNACIERLSAVYHQSVAYIAPDRYWAMQWLEAGIFLAAALALVGAAIWAVERVPS